MGWTPEVTWQTPVPQLLLALDGKRDFLDRTNPFGALSKKRPKEKPLSEEAQANARHQREVLSRAMLDFRAKR